MTDEASRLVEEGNDLEDRGLLAEAQALYRRAIAAAPHMPRPWLNLGNVLERQGQFDEAIEAATRAVAVAPGFAPAHFNLGRLLLARHREGEAETELRTALAQDPRFTDAALVLAGMLRAGEDERVLRGALAHAPDHPGAQYNLALLLMERDEFDEAEALLRNVLEHAPDFALACGALGNVCMKTGRAREAEAWHRRRWQADPRSPEAAAPFLFSLLARDDLTPEAVFAAHREAAAATEHACGARLHYRPRTRIRVGYLSPDFRQHPVALFVEPVLAAHDRARFELFCYYNHAGDDAVTRRLMDLADHWRNVAGLAHADVAQHVRDDGIDVLVDLAGHTGESRLPVFPLRAAPVQATWLGYLHSTGFASADYRICDAQTDPPGTTEHLHTERLLRLPHSQWCYRPLHEGAAAPPARAPRAGVVLGSFNQYWKASPACLAAWLAILREAPEASLRVVGVPAGRTREALLARAESAGVASERLTLLPRLGIREYFEALAQVDVALDTTPYNGGTTTLDALWMGVPLVALRGDRPLARGAASILTALGMPELVAADTAQYVEVNVRLVRDAAWRARLAGELRPRLAASPLMDGARFTRDLEALYLQALAAA